jgi:hypothetical protein
MARANARGAFLMAIIGLILVLFTVAQWKRNSINAWRGALADDNGPPPPTIYHDDAKNLEAIAEANNEKAPTVAPAVPVPVPDFSAANSTLGVR